MLKFNNNRLYNNKIIKQSKSFLNKYKSNNLNNNAINSLTYLKTSGNIQNENNKCMKHYYNNNETNIDKKNNIKDKIKNEKSNNINYNFSPTPTPSTSTTNKTQKLSNVYFFQKNFFKINSNRNNNIDNFNSSNIRTNKTNSNNNDNKNIYLTKKKKNNKNHNKHELINSNTNEIKITIKASKDEKNLKEKNAYNSKLKKESLSLEDHFDNEIKINNFKNPEEFHFFYIKVFQAENEICQNFENEDF